MAGLAVAARLEECNSEAEVTEETVVTVVAVAIAVDSEAVSAVIGADSVAVAVALIQLPF